MTITDRLGRTVGSILPNSSETDPQAGLAIKTPVRVATTANIALNGLLSIDGVTVAAGDRVLVSSQSDTTQNGIYTVSSGNWSRTTDFDDLGEMVKGTQVYINEGSVNGAKTSYVTSSDPITPDTTALTWSVPHSGSTGGSIIVDTRATAVATAFGTDINAVVTCGYTTAGDGGGAVYKRGAGSGSFTDAGSVVWSLDMSRGVVNPRWFGAKGDGVTDDTTALQAAITASIGKHLHLGDGNYGISALLDGGAGNIRISGAGKSRSIISVLGSSAVDPILKFTDASDVIVEDIDFRGNSVTVVIGAMQFLVTAGSNVIGNYIIQRNAFSNLKAQYWIRFLTNVASTSHTRIMRYVRVLNNDWSASTSLAPDFTSVGIQSMMLALQGSVDNSGSYIDDVIIEGNFANASGVKGFLTCWAGSRNVIVRDNFILNSGGLGQNDRGCYALLAYNNHASADTAYSPMDLLITGNTIVSARSMGFYGATATRVNLIGNSISGVQDTTAASLPYAAISLGQCDDSKANFNELNDNYVGIQAIPTPTSVIMEVVGNKIRSSVTSAIGVRSTVVGSFASKVRVRDNHVVLTGSGSVGISGSSVGAGFEFDKLDIIGNRVYALSSGIVVNDSSGGGIRANQVTIQSNHIDGAFTSAAINCDSAVAKTIAIDNTINLASAGAAATGFFAPSAVSIQVDGLTLLNRATGTAFAFSASAAVGAVRNVNFVGIARANLPADASGHLGFQIPTFTGAIASFVQNLSTTFYTEAGAAASKYTVDGWVNTSGSTTWLAKRLLTGN